MATIRIEIKGQKAKLVVDGIDVSDQIVWYKLVHRAGKIPSLLIQVYPDEVLVLEEDVEVKKLFAKIDEL